MIKAPCRYRRTRTYTRRLDTPSRSAAACPTVGDAANGATTWARRTACDQAASDNASRPLRQGRRLRVHGRRTVVKGSLEHRRVR